MPSLTDPGVFVGNINAGPQYGFPHGSRPEMSFLKSAVGKALKETTDKFLMRPLTQETLQQLQEAVAGTLAGINASSGYGPTELLLEAVITGGLESADAVRVDLNPKGTLADSFLEAPQADDPSPNLQAMEFIATTPADSSPLQAVYFTSTTEVGPALASGLQGGIKARVAGFIKSKSELTVGTVQTAGELPGFTGLKTGFRYYLSAQIAGEITSIQPSRPDEVVVEVGVATTPTTLMIKLNPWKPTATPVLLEPEESPAPTPLEPEEPLSWGGWPLGAPEDE
jgi:hypothetical protein